MNRTAKISTALIGIETGLLKGIETLRWTLDSIQSFGEISAISTVVQSINSVGQPQLRVVIKLITPREPDELINRLVDIEGEYDEKIKIMDTMRCLLLAYDQAVSLTPAETLPHPQMLSDAAWLYCSWEVWKSYWHPVMEQTLDKLLSERNVTNVEFHSQGKAILTTVRV